MGIFDKLEEIRSRSERAKKKLLFIWLAISMIIVITIWIGILKLDNTDGNKENDNVPNPFEVLKNGFQSSKEQIKKVPTR